MAGLFCHHTGRKSPAHEETELGVKQEELAAFELCSRKGLKLRVGFNMEVF